MAGTFCRITGSGHNNVAPGGDPMPRPVASSPDFLRGAIVQADVTSKSKTRDEKLGKPPTETANLNTLPGRENGPGNKETTQEATLY